MVAGAVWMWLAGAPPHYALVNLGALVLVSPWVLFGRGPHTSLSRHLLAAAMLLVMLSPIWIGQELRSITGHTVTRWFPLGPLSLHTGMIAAPALVVLAARNRKFTAPILLAALLAAWLQPDAATGFALTIAAVGIHHVTKDWRVGVTAIIGFLASIEMAMRGEIPPQPFVERVLVDAMMPNVAAGMALLLALAASFALLLYAIPFDRTKRFALAALLLGFTVMSVMTSYPTPLIGYGAAPILGFGIALGLHSIPQR
ncbi:hypothetical protein D6201_05635 [Aurantiacibacter aquimixticola]|uniref:Uncharacterized protein n=1 Tax=Aurantiacibacter aquimixticola TaxID=1958945 RepID=A0A419RSZ6_9SPHN|nr:hypothetical protein D6201_05635 [Aurantiacibacter aquimixticola]